MNPTDPTAPEEPKNEDLTLQSRLEMEDTTLDSLENISPALAERLENPDYRSWWEDQARFDHAFASKLSSVAVPSDLREMIEAGVHLEQNDSRSRRRFLAGLGSAAAVVSVGLAAGWAYRGRSHDRLIAFRSHVINTLDTMNGVEYQAPNLPKILSWLSEQNRASDLALFPAAAESIPTHGCRLLEWSGVRGVLVCFKGEEVPDTVHYVIMDSALGLDAAAEPTLAKVDSWDTAVWEDSAHSYLLASKTRSDAFDLWLG
ncbi:MAG: hypothetical protein AAF236_12970 [Verrucomicrobiota bacterium]